MSPTQRFMARAWCLLRGGHRPVRYTPTVPGSIFQTLRIAFHPPQLEHVWFDYEPCRRCGMLYLHDWGSGEPQPAQSLPVYGGKLKGLNKDGGAS